MASSEDKSSGGLGAGLDTYLSRLDRARAVQVRGRVREVTGLVVRASVPDANVGDLVKIYGGRGEGEKLAEVVGFKDDLAVLMPLGEVDGIGPDAEVEATGEPLSIWCGEGCWGGCSMGSGNRSMGVQRLAARVSSAGRS